MAENIKQLSNAFSLGGGLNINSNQPIDSRFKVQLLVELTYDWKNKNNGGEISKYEGLLTYVEEVGKTFRYRTGASYTQGETTIANWELVPVSVDDINSLVEIPEVVYPEYELVAGDTNSIKLVKDGEVVDEVSISLTADVVTTTEENTEKVTALSLATEQNIGKIILVKTAEGDYLAGTYIVDGVGSVKYLATTTGTVDDGDVDAKINSAIDSLDSTISANENEYLTSITIENGKLVSSTSAPVPTYTGGNNISIEDNVISALGYTYNAEKSAIAINGNTSSGLWSFSEGRDSTASGIRAHAEGWDTISSGQNAHSEGAKTEASGFNSHAEGGYTKALGEESHTEGWYTIANNSYEHAEGKLNKSNSGETDDLKTLHSIGIGSGEEDRKNAQEVMQNGDFYVINVGGYDGTNPSEALTLQEVIEDISAYEAPEYTIKKNHSDADKKTTYTLYKDGIAISTEESDIIEVNDSLIVNQTEEGDIIIADKHVLVTSDLDDYKIKDVIATDKVLAVDVDGKLSSTISLKHGTITEEVDGETVTYPTIELIGKDEQLISYIGVSDFIKDGFLISASYNEETYQLTLTWNTDSGVETTNIDLTDLVHGLESESEATDLVKIEISNNSATKPENEPFKYIVSIDETNLQNKLDEIDGAFIKSVVDNDTATYVKVNAETNDQVVTISVDESALSTKLTEMDGKYLPYGKIVTGEVVGTFVNISLNVDDTSKELSVSLDETKLGEKITDVEERITKLENTVDDDTKCESATINAGTTSELTEGEVAVLSNTTITLSGDGTALSGTATAVNVVTKQYVTGIETALDERITELENAVDDDTKCESATINAGTPSEVATEGEVTVLSNTTITLSGDGTALSGTATAVNVVTKQYVDGRFDSLVDNDTKCESATINAGTPAEAATEGEVTVLSNTNITLSGDGTALSGTATAVNVVTKQYVDSKFDEVPTFEAITTSEIDGIFTQG